MPADPSAPSQAKAARDWRCEKCGGCAGLTGEVRLIHECEHYSPALRAEIEKFIGRNGIVSLIEGSDADVLLASLEMFIQYEVDRERQKAVDEMGCKQHGHAFLHCAQCNCIPTE